MSDQYVIFWYFSGVAGDHHYETFETLEGAKSTLSDWAKFYPSNTYHLAKIIDTHEATQKGEKNHGPKVTFTDNESGEKASFTIENGTITAVRVGCYARSLLEQQGSNTL